MTAFYALALMGTSHDGRDIATYMKAAALAGGCGPPEPGAPRATHYLIHAYDDTAHAPLGVLRGGLQLIAPAASHALHMPSHIYFALGLGMRRAAGTSARPGPRTNGFPARGWASTNAASTRCCG
ncbi:MAG: hypothetical protein R2712_23330 [Vicinamibacterales bacterium]